MPQSLLFTLIMFMLLYCVILAISSTFSWNLTLLDLDLAEVSHVSLVGVRAILSVPRKDELQQYTLLEAPWPDRPKLIPFNPRPFPNREPQVVGDCAQIQSAISSDWDGYRHLLVLDLGWLTICPPKILLYDFITNKQTVGCELKNVPRAGLASLVVDGSRAYIGEAEAGKLIVYELHAPHWWMVNLVYSSELNTQLPSTSQLTVSGPILYMASELSDDLYELDINPLRLTQNLSNVEFQVETRGKLLAPPKGMVADKQGLYYCVPRDFVCLRWDTRLPLVAESHQVLLQSAELLPKVHQLFFDLQKQLWALTDKTNETQCVRIRKPIPDYLWI